MDIEYWLNRWRQNRIGFHQDTVNPYLERFLPELNLPPGARVFVPLCGKSRDMHWLAHQGLGVLGVEVSAGAIAAFFSETGLPPERARRGAFECWASGSIRLLCGDFFGLTAADLEGAAAAYDRAALIAFPPELRGRYARHCAELLPPGAQLLLITYEYPQEQMPGPPFSVGRNEIEALYRPAFDLRVLSSEDALERKANLREQGLSRLVETVFLLTRR